MVLMTMIARVVDGLPLAATMQEDEQSGCNVLEYQNQAKMLFRKLGPQSPLRCSIETGPYLFHYLIENEICYLVLCERNYSKRLAFSYLEEIAQEFYQQYGKRVNTVTRPYTFIEFDTWMQRTRKQYAEGGPRARRTGATAALQGQLGDVQRIMMQNIDDVLQRGAVLSELDTKTQNLSIMTQKYKKDATYLNTKSMLVKVTAGAVVLLVFVLYFWVL
ncbi:vesicle-trafficking protein SEC22b-B [Amyelois transitella]|uniref:vesicle-trafficking protein SEC22b-B n=1 Tax=Amyelois transitella TaxID=680683 RepID=UPI00067C9C03|nr:vesicle-trafficking protein SEC22b-B [Amyelois transitella]